MAVLPRYAEQASHDEGLVKGSHHGVEMSPVGSVVDLIRTFRELSTIARNCGAESLTPLDAAGAKAAVKC